MRLRSLLPLCGAVLLSAGFMPSAKADFTGSYSLSNFTLTNTNADGFAAVSPDNSILTLTGGNTGSGEPGVTDLTIQAAAAGSVQFSYLFSLTDAPGEDWAGYLLNGQFTQLAGQDGESGTIMFNVAAGDSFGFEVATLDNTGEPGILTVSDFAAPEVAGTVPEPCGLLLVGAGAGVAVLARKLRRTQPAEGAK